MLRNIRKLVAVLTTVALAACGVLAVPTVASAKSVSVKIVAKLRMTGGGKTAGTASVTVGSTKVSKASATGSVAPPHMVTTFKLKGGTITATVNNGKIVSGTLVGTFTLKGTGQYKAIKGGGKLSAPVTTLIFTFSGSATL